MIHVKGHDNEAIILNRRTEEGYLWLLVRELAQDGSALREAYYRGDFVTADEDGELQRAIAAAPEASG